MDLEQGKKKEESRLKNQWDLTKEELAKLGALPVIPSPTEIEIIRLENPNLFMLVFKQLESQKATMLIESSPLNQLIADYKEQEDIMEKENPAA